MLVSCASHTSPLDNQFTICELDGLLPPHRVATVPTTLGSKLNLDRRIHFFSHVSSAELDSWDPDTNPEFYPNGHGHAILELYARMHRRGYSVSAGPTAPSGTAILVLGLDQVSNYAGLQLAKAISRAWRAAFVAGHVVLIRNDVPIDLRAPFPVSLTIAPNQQSVVDKDHLALPLLPQRGLIARDPLRGDTLENVSIKCHASNLPEECLDGSLERLLADLGVRLRLDVEPTAWANFRDVDIVLGPRRRTNDLALDDLRRKPPTKLVNAWAGGVIPVLSPEPAFHDLGIPGADVLFASGTDEIVSVIRDLKENPTQVTSLFDAVRKKQIEQSVILDDWLELFLSSNLRPIRARLIKALPSTIAIMIHQGLLSRRSH